MIDITLYDEDLQKAAAGGMDAFIQLFVDAMMKGVGGNLDAGALQKLNADQVTLLAYCIMRDEVMDGGFLQLIYNGYGGFIFDNPFAYMMKQWGLRDLGKLLYNVRSLYLKYGDEITRECSDDEFMAMFEQYPMFDDFDDDFVENEEEWTNKIAYYVDEHIDKFAKIVRQAES